MNRRDFGLLGLCSGVSLMTTLKESEGAKVKVVEAGCCSYYTMQCTGKPSNRNILDASEGKYKSVGCKAHFKDDGKYSLVSIEIDLWIEEEALQEFKELRELMEDGFLYVVKHKRNLIGVPLFGVFWASEELSVTNNQLN